MVFNTTAKIPMVIHGIPVDAGQPIQLLYWGRAYERPGSSLSADSYDLFTVVKVMNSEHSPRASFIRAILEI